MIIRLQLQLIPTINAYKTKLCQFVQLLRMFVILAESLTLRIGWQYADYLLVNASDSKDFQTITR